MRLTDKRIDRFLQYGNEIIVLLIRIITLE